MKIFAISDLHLPGGQEKPMEIFGEQWQRHFDRIAYDWRLRVSPEDIVLICGDISWAMTLSQAMDDLTVIGKLPGSIIMTRGNHDYWWSSITRTRKALRPGFYALQNDALFLNGTLFAGTRGWPCPGSREFSEQDEKLYKREIQRMEMSLAAARAISKDAPLVAMIHYPPFNEKHEDSGYTGLFLRYGANVVLYGHLHGRSISGAFSGEHYGTRYRLTSCDALNFSLMEVEI